MPPTRGVRERRWLRFDYRKPGEKVVERRRVRPYHVLEYGGCWYLLAYDPKRVDVRTFVLGRMREAVLLEERFERPRDFDVRKYLEKAIGVMAGTGDYQVAIQMDAWLTDTAGSPSAPAAHQRQPPRRCPLLPDCPSH